MRRRKESIKDQGRLLGGKEQSQACVTGSRSAGLTPFAVELRA